MCVRNLVHNHLQCICPVPCLGGVWVGSHKYYFKHAIDKQEWAFSICDCQLESFTLHMSRPESEVQLASWDRVGCKVICFEHSCANVCSTLQCQILWHPTPLRYHPLPCRAHNIKKAVGALKWWIVLYSSAWLSLDGISYGLPHGRH